MRFQCFDEKGNASEVFEGWEKAEKMPSTWAFMLVETGKKPTSYSRNENGEWACYQFGKNTLGLKFAD